MAQARRAKSKKANKRQKARILIVEARFYDDIADALLKGATDVIKKAGATYDRLTVPGSLEIPAAIAFAIEAAERKGKPYDGAVALGCVIRGDTFHFEIVATQSARALMDLAVAYRLPLGNGILTVDTESQAWARANVEEGNKGGEAARAALDMLRLKRSLGGTL
ncbi:MAG: 6,7-dimethyl-8-ribityllumazine synthase [Hyphomicrobiales bacterium]